jgi:hypothetical protein
MIRASWIISRSKTTTPGAWRMAKPPLYRYGIIDDGMPRERQLSQ